MSTSPNAPPGHYNRPGLQSLIYRVDTHPTFLRRMFSRLSRGPLAQLRTRDEDDPAIALLDAWAILADVVTFYQERIANEGFLRTATERRSVLELARAIGYELDPGVAAGTFLAFTVEQPDPLKRNRSVPVPKGTRVQSIPHQGQMPQTFETSAEFTARHDWNSLRPKLTQVCAPSASEPTLYLSGINTNLKPGDLLLLIDSKQTGAPVRVQQIEIDQEYGHTQVEFTTSPDFPIPNELLSVLAFRTHLGLFGCNAPYRKSLPDDANLTKNLGQNQNPYPYDWDAAGWEIWKDPNTNSDYADTDIYLERNISGIVAGDWLVIQNMDGTMLVHQTQAVIEVSRQGFGLSAKVTGLSLNPARQQGDSAPKFTIRDSLVHLQGERLLLAEMPLSAILKDAKSLKLDQKVDGLQAGQLLALSGELEGVPGEVGHEVLTLENVSESGELIFREPLQLSYVRKTVSINANVARATHGETVREVLGSGDGSQPNQRFTLKKLPLTYLAAPTADGVQSALEVRINDILWDQAPSLHGLTPGQKKYLVKIDDDGATHIVFGDGLSGARLPSGRENIVATYRSGLGPNGEVPGNTLSLLQTRPQGIRSVTNPLPASGAAAPDDIEQARAKAPLHILTMDRLVSLRDYEYFAGAFAGIGKVQAVSLWAGQAKLVHLTVAGLGGSPVTSASDLYRNLLQAIDSHRDPLQSVRIDSYQPRSFGLAAKVLVDPAYRAASVFGFVREALIATFSFEQRAFGQPVSAAGIISIIQGLPGVVAVDLDTLYFADTSDAPQETSIPAQLLTIDSNELLTIHATHIILDEMTR